MTDEDRIARLVAEIEDLPFEEREAVIASLSDDDRTAVWDAQLKDSETAVPDDDEEVGGHDRWHAQLQALSWRMRGGAARRLGCASRHTANAAM